MTKSFKDILNDIENPEGDFKKFTYGANKIDLSELDQMSSHIDDDEFVKYVKVAAFVNFAAQIYSGSFNADRFKDMINNIVSRMNSCHRSVEGGTVVAARRSVPSSRRSTSARLVKGG